MNPEASILFGQIAIKKGLVTPQQLHECLQLQGELAQRGTRKLIGEIMKEKNLLTDAQISVILTIQKKMLAQTQDVLFGKAAVAGGYATVNQVKECLAIQENIRKNRSGSEPSLAEIMVSKGYITAQQRGLVEKDAVGRRPQQPAAGAPGGEVTHIPGLHARHALEGKPCQFCKMAIRSDQAVQICGGCSGIYHAECWAETGGCTNSGCEECKDKPLTSEGSARAAGKGLAVYFAARAGIAAAVVIAIVALVVLTRKSAEDCYREAKKIEESISGSQSGEERAWNIFDHKRAELTFDEMSGKVIGGAERRQNREKQLEWLKKTVEKDPKYVDAWFDMGVVYNEFKNTKEAYDSFKKVAEIDPKHDMAHVMLGMILEEDKDFGGAESEYKAAMASSSRVGPGHRALGVLYDDKFGGAREKEAADVYRQFLLSREDAEICARLGLILVAEGSSMDQALALFDKAMRLDPKLRMARYGRARVAYQQGKIPEASALLAELVSGATNPDYTRLYGLCLARERRYDDAILELSKAAAAFPTDMELHCMLADVYMAVGRAAEAAQALKNISNLAPRDVKLLFKRGTLALAAGSNDEAKNLFERGKDIDPEFPEIWYYLAKATIPSRDLAQFNACFNEAVKRAPDDLKVPLLESEFKRARAAFAEARTVCKTVLAKNPEFGPAYLELGLIARKQGNIADAIENFRVAIAKGGCDEAYLEIGTLYYELAKYDKARVYFQDYLDKAPLTAQSRSVREYLQVISYYGSGGVARGSVDTSQKLSEWLDSMQAGSVSELHETLALTATALAYLACCIKGETDKEPLLGQKLQMMFQMRESYVIPNDATADIVRLQYFDFMTTQYVLPSGVEAVEILKGIAAGGAPKSQLAVAALKVYDDLKKALAALPADSQVDRVEAVTRAWVRLFEILARKHNRAAQNASALEALMSQYDVQESLCLNPLQKVCNDLYTCAQLAGLIVAMTDSATGPCRDKVTLALDELDRSDRDAETCGQQMHIGATALLRVLQALASESGVAAEASLRAPK